MIDGSSGIFDFVFHLVELSRVDERGCSLLLPYRTVPGITNIIVQVVNSMAVLMPNQISDIIVTIYTVTKPQMYM